MYLDESTTAAGADQDVKASITVPPQAHSAETKVTHGFISQTRCRAADSVITRFRAALTNIQSSELQRLYGRLPGLDDHSREAIRQFADCLVANVLHPPVECLRKEERNGSQKYLLKALQRLFQLSD